MHTTTARFPHQPRRHGMASARIGLSALIGLMSLMAHAPSWAHDDAYLDSLQAPHGGQIRMAGTLHLELVVHKDGSDAKPRPIELYVTDHAGAKQATAGASATVTLLSGKNKASAMLKPAGDNKFTGQASYASTPDLKAIVSVTMPGEDAQQARFTPLAPRAAQAASR